MQKLENINLSKLRKCDQVWEEMSPTERGRICQKCQQTIIDFRHLQKNEIAEIHSFTEGKVCGLYRKEQLEITKGKESFRLKAGSMLTGLLGLLTVLNVNAQIENDSTETIQTESVYKEDAKEKIINRQKLVQTVKDSIIVSGSLKNHTGEPTIFANVHIEGTEIGTSSDIDGNYYLDVTAPIDSLNEITLVFSYVGFLTEKIKLSKEQLAIPENRKLNITFQEGEIIEFYVIEKQPLHKRIWSSIKRIFRKKK